MSNHTPVVIDQPTSTTDLMLNEGAMNNMYRMAQTMADGRATVPTHLQGNVADCMAVVMQAALWRMNPFAVAQKTHVVSGTLGYEAQLVNAVVKCSGSITGRFHYEYVGDWTKCTKTKEIKIDKPAKGGGTYSKVELVGDWTKQDEEGLYIIVGAVLCGESEITWGEPLYLSSVAIRNSPLWHTNPKQQIAYLGVKYWARLYCPEAILGVYSSDELEPEFSERDITPQPEKRANSRLNQALNGATVATEQAQTVEHPAQAALPNLSEKLEMSLRDCSNMDELLEVGESIKKAVESSQIDAVQRKALGQLFTKCQRDFASVDTSTGEVA